jgi:hypothetical protein
MIVGVSVEFNFCTISSAVWHAIEATSLIGGVCFGLILQWLLKGAGFNLKSSRLQTFAGGCLLPMLFGLACTIWFNAQIPNDPCGGAFTPDSYFVQLVILPLTTLSAIGAFWAMVWRR